MKDTKEKKEAVCPECFKVVGDKTRYRIVCLLGKEKNGLNVSTLTETLGLTQPTVTHHLQVLESVGAVVCVRRGRERIYSLQRDAHCFLECGIRF